MIRSVLRGYVLEFLNQTDSDTFYLDATINALLNEAYYAFYNLLTRVSPEYTTEYATGTITAAASDLTLPTDFASVYGFEYRLSTSDKFQDGNWYDMMRYGSKYTGDDTGAPKEFYFKKRGTDNKMVFLQPVDQNYLYNLIYKTKLETADLMAADGDDPEYIPAEYQMWLVYHAVLNYLPKNQDQSRTDVMKPLWNLLSMVEDRMKAELGSLQLSTPQKLAGWRSTGK